MKTITIKLPDEMVRQIDEAGGALPRERYIRDLLQFALHSHDTVAAALTERKAKDRAKERADKKKRDTINISTAQDIPEPQP